MPEYDRVRAAPKPRAPADRTKSPAATQRQPPMPAGPGNILTLQRLAGNQAVASALAIQRDGPPRSVGGQVGAAVGGPTAGHSLSASATIAGGQVLSSSGGKTIHTVGDTTVRVSVSTTGLSVDFGPSLVITKHDAIGWIDVDIDLHRLSWNFTNQMLHASWTAARLVNWVGGVGGELLGPFRSALNELPSRCSEAGYDPFTDPDLPADLQALVRRLASAGGGSLPRMSGAQVDAGLTFATGLTRDVGHGVSIVVPPGTHVTATATLAGDVPATAADLRVASVRLSARGGIRLDLQALGQSWPVIHLSSATLTPGGQITADYSIIHEDIGTALVQLLAAATVQADPGAAGAIRDDLTVRDRAARQLVEQLVRDNVEPALRDAVRANRAAIPGVDLAQVLGI